MIFFIKSWETEVESTSSKPAAVESAAANAPGHHQRNDPFRQFRHFGVCQNDDILVVVDLVGRRFVALVRNWARTVFSSQGIVEFRFAGKDVASPVLHDAVLVFVDPSDHSLFFPVLEPLGGFLIFLLVDFFDEIGPGEHSEGRSGQVNDGDEAQSPIGRLPDGFYVFDGKEANDHVRQTRRSDHQRRRNAEEVIEYFRIRRYTP